MVPLLGIFYVHPLGVRGGLQEPPGQFFYHTFLSTSVLFFFIYRSSNPSNTRDSNLGQAGSGLCQEAKAEDFCVVGVGLLDHRKSPFNYSGLIIAQKSSQRKKKKISMFPPSSLIQTIGFYTLYITILIDHHSMSQKTNFHLVILSGSPKTRSIRPKTIFVYYY
jgi:hypothetical protein